MVLTDVLFVRLQETRAHLQELIPATMAEEDAAAKHSFLFGFVTLECATAVQ